MSDRDLWLMAELLVIMQFDGTQQVNRQSITNIIDVMFSKMIKLKGKYESKTS